MYMDAFGLRMLLGSCMNRYLGTLCYYGGSLVIKEEKLSWNQTEAHFVCVQVLNTSKYWSRACLCGSINLSLSI